MSGTWDFLLTDAAGNALAELSTANSRAITFKRNTYVEFVCTLSHDDDAAALLLNALANTGVPKVRGYRRGPNDSLDQPAPLKFRGYLAGLQEQADDAAWLTATFRSPFGALLGDGDKIGRQIQTPVAYAATDAGAIARTLVDTANSDSFTGLATDPTLIAATVARDRSYAVGQNIGSAITELSAVLDGFDFFESFVDAGTSVLSPVAGAPSLLAGRSTPNWVGATGTYYWVVTAVVGGVETGPSNEITETVAASGHGAESVSLTWGAVTGASAYNVYRSTSTGGETTSPALVASLGAVTSYVDSGAATTTGAVPAVTRTIWYPDALFNAVASQGVVNTNAVFEYGQTTLSNVQSVTRTTQPPQNCVLVTGGNGLQSVYTDATSVAKYGKWWTRADFSTIIEQSTLDAKARALCRPNPVTTVTFVPDIGLDSCPKPWDDWNLGDTVTLHAERNALSVNTQLRVNGFTIPIDENGLESVAVNDVSSPEQDALIRAALIAEVV